MSDEWLAGIQRHIAAKQLLPPRGRILVAVSGGADSVALLHVLAHLQPEWNFILHVAHLDHALRKDSREDAEFVRELGARLQIPVTIERSRVRSICASEGWSLEEGARRIRYRFLLAVARQQSASHIALAHTADDQAETVLMRLLRGAGLLGLSAIPATRDLEGVWLVRPLLEVWRREIIVYLDRGRLTYREDATNLDRRFVRNRIRHELLPMLERDYNPRMKQALVQLAKQCASDDAYLQQASARQWKRLAKPLRPACSRRSASQSEAERSIGGAGRPAQAEPRTSSRDMRSISGTEPRKSLRDFRGQREPSGVAIAVSAFRRQPKALQRHLVRRAIREVRGDLRQFEFRHWLEMERLFETQPSGTLLSLPGGIRLRREAAHVICQRAEGSSGPTAHD